MDNQEYYNIMNAVLTVRDIRDRSEKLVDALNDLDDFISMQLNIEQEEVMKNVIAAMRSIVNYTALREEYDCKRILDICKEDEDREEWLDKKIDSAIAYFTRADKIDKMDKNLFVDKVFGDVPQAIRCDGDSCNVE